MGPPGLAFGQGFARASSRRSGSGGTYHTPTPDGALCFSIFRAWNTEARASGVPAAASASGVAKSAGGQIDWDGTFEWYSADRKPNTDAIQDMAEENFYEMRDATADPVFQRKRQLETKLEQRFPDYFSKYSMVTFRKDMPYAVAKEKGNAQDRLLMNICSQELDVERIDVEATILEVRNLR